MWNKLRIKLEEQKNVIIFGCTVLGIEILKTVELMHGDSKLFFYDNAPEKQGTLFGGRSVITREQLREYIGNSVFILASVRFYEEMQEQLLKIHVLESDILFPTEILEIEIKKNKEIVQKRMPRKDMYIVVDLAEHCNLNCQNCSHFAPLSEEHFADINVFERDIKRISEVMGEKICCVKLEGGEPLLNARVTEFIEVTHQYLPKAEVWLLTNGVLLDKMTQRFWEICREHNVLIYLTKYPISVDYDKISEKAENNGVCYKYSDCGEVVKTSIHMPLDIQGKQDKYISFCNCCMANGTCVSLKNGRLYSCTMTSNLHIFNKYFGTNLELTSKDYVDIYSDITSEDIFDFVCNPVPACRYCRINEWTTGYEWKTSRKKIEEWT